MGELAIVQHLQYSYVHGASPVHEPFEPIARWFDEDDNSREREDVVVRLDISPLRNRRHYLGAWTPKRTMRQDDAMEKPRRQYRIGSLPDGGPVPRIGFLKGVISVPDDFDTMFQDEIQAMFEG
ncbi:hypothetical protein [Sphingomonas sp. T9W2]|uniref:hypothetical protein n=1 Tax=Sphingomonas sp. T9W2 TaxID=3143183 RepID=UPI0031F51DDB